MAFDPKKVLGKMTAEEKARILSGADFWHTEAFPELDVPRIMMSDGPHGLRKSVMEETDTDNDIPPIEAVCFPAACATSASFDKELMAKLGRTIARECLAEDVSIILGPAINIKRSPLCGRNFEYISEDPFLAGEMAAAYIEACQAEGVGVSLKHFAANNQEHERMYESNEIDEQTLREIYLRAFEIAVRKAKPWTIMASYNKINGTYTTESRKLLTDILRDEWGFDGMVMSDWAAVSDRIAGLKAGMNLEMPSSGGVNDILILNALKTGEITEEELDSCVLPILEIVAKCVNTLETKGLDNVFDRKKDHRKAVKMAEKCITLLKNDGMLPLKKSDKVLFIGGFFEKPRFQGGGSSHIYTKGALSAKDIYKDYGNAAYSEGFPADRDESDPIKFRDALEMAESADKIVVFAGLPDSFESEGFDRDDMKLPKCQNKLIKKLIALGKPVAVVLHNGAPLELPWAIGTGKGTDTSGYGRTLGTDGKCGAIVEAYLTGEGQAEALMNVLYGKKNPEGRLAESFPVKLEDNPSYLNFPGIDHKVNYAEGVFVGYRYYDTKKMDVMFPFGYGLSYTAFEYSPVKAAHHSFKLDDGIDIRFTVTNTGNVKGTDTPQIYISDKTRTAIRPVHELKAFEKLELQPGESREVMIHLGKEAFEHYSAIDNAWIASAGFYSIELGSSSRDIKSSTYVELKDGVRKLPFISRDTQIGDLLDCHETSDYIKERLSDFLYGGQEDAGDDAPSYDENNDMGESFVKYLPLRSLRSFVHMTNEELDGIVDDLIRITGQDK